MHTAAAPFEVSVAKPSAEDAAADEVRALTLADVKGIPGMPDKLWQILSALFGRMLR